MPFSVLFANIGLAYGKLSVHLQDDQSPAASPLEVLACGSKSRPRYFAFEPVTQMLLQLLIIISVSFVSAKDASDLGGLLWNAQFHRGLNVFRVFVCRTLLL